MAFASLLDARPRPGADYRSRSGYRTAGLAIAFLGLLGAVAVLVAGVVAGNLLDEAGREATARGVLAWAFGLNATALTTAKLGIATVLVGILVRLWLRVESAREALPALKPAATGLAPSVGVVTTPYGPATVSERAPKPLFVHRMARVMWLPSLLMGAMAVVAGLVVSIAQASVAARDPALATRLSAWVQGTQFLGEGFMLSAISFLLGTILASLRGGGGEVQESLGLAVKTLRKPATANAFVGLMMVGLMAAVAQFVVYAVVSTVDDPSTVAAFFAWLGPVREAALGLILTGIVFALVTIAKAVGFTFWRMREIVATGR